MYVAPLSAIVVCLACGLSLLGTLTGYVDGTNTIVGTFSQGFGGFVIPLLPMFLLSMFFGRVYIASGAATNIARTVMKIFVRNNDPQKKRIAAVLCCTIVSFFVVYGGMDSFCALFTLFPIVITLMSEANIPRKWVLGLINCGVTAAVCMPGAPSTQNYIALGILGTSTTASLIPGIIGSLTILVGGTIYLSWGVCRSGSRGECFEAGKIAFEPVDATRTYPPFIISIIPLLLVTILFNVTASTPIALFFGFLCALVLLGRYVKPQGDMSRGKTIIFNLNEGGKSAAESLFMGGIIGGLAAVVQSTAAYGAIVDSVLSLKIAPAILVIIAVTIIVGLTGNSTVALQVALPTIAQNVVIPASTLHRLAVISTLTLDTAPFQSPILILLNMSDLKAKDGYPPMAVCTVILPFVGALLTALICTLFPGLS